jgi:prolyl oligopeptidase PreP (S9A serine peptidase family)
MDNIYLLGSKDIEAFSKYHIPTNTKEIKIDESRLKVLKKDMIAYCFDKMSSMEHGDIIIFNKFFYRGKYYDSYDKLVDYMIDYKILEMDVHHVSFMMVNNQEAEEVLYFYHHTPGIFKLSDIEKHNEMDDMFSHIFIPEQKKRFFFQRRLSLLEIRELYSKRNEICPYDTLNYVFHKVLEDADNCHEVSYDLISDFCRSNERIDLFS